MKLYEIEKKRPDMLNQVYQALTSVPPTSCESERGFSGLGLLHTKLRTKLGDRIIEDLVILRHYFLAEKKKKEAPKIKRTPKYQ